MNRMFGLKNAQFKAARLGDRIVLPSHVYRGQTGITCLDCGEELIVRKGEIKVHHFSHKTKCSNPVISTQLASGESREHIEAKYKIVERFNNSTNIQISKRICHRCYKTETIHDLTKYKQNGYLACIEYGYWDKNMVRRSADVAITDNSGNIHMIIEILNTHPTPEANRAGYNWIELNANSVIHNTNDQFCCVRDCRNQCSDCVLEIEAENKRIQKMLFDYERELERKRIMEERRIEREKHDEIIRLYVEKRKRLDAVMCIQASIRRKSNQPEYAGVILEMRKRVAEQMRHATETGKNKYAFNKVIREIPSVWFNKQLAKERKLKMEIDRNRAIFTRVLTNIKETVKWIEPIIPPMKKLVMTTITPPVARVCLICRRWNNDRINKCVCEHPKYKPLDRVIRFA
jgi:hypothetical protein